jgi:hypothetical protein
MYEADKEIHALMQEPLDIFSEEVRASTLYEIEVFIRQILNTEEVAFIFDRDSPGVIKRHLEFSSKFQFIDTFLDTCFVSSHYSLYVELLPMAVKKLNLSLFNFGKHPEVIRGDFKEPVGETFNRLIREIRNAGRSKKFRQSVYSASNNIKRGYQEYTKYIDDLQDTYSRMLVLRVDCHFKPTKQHDPKKVSLDEARILFKKFLNNKRRNKTFKGTVGYIWKLQYGRKKTGIHFHTFFFLNNRTETNDAYRAKLIGEYWNKITDGKGGYHNSNYKKEKFSNIGISVGRLSHYDAEMRKNLDRNLLYFFTKDQMLLEKSSKKIKTIGRGASPKNRIKTNSGRPRSVHEN